MFITYGTKEPMFDAMINTTLDAGKNKAYRSTGFMWFKKGDRAWFTKYMDIPAHIMPSYCNWHYCIILRFDYEIQIMDKGAHVDLQKIRIFYPKGLHLPYRITKEGKWLLCPYDRETNFLDVEKGIPLIKSNRPVFPDELMVETYKTRFYPFNQKRTMREENRAERWKGLAQDYI